MTSAQWLFEYLALREKEKEEGDLIADTMKALRLILIQVLGLNLMSTKEDKEANEDMDTPFVPLSLMAGRREIIELILEKMGEEDKTQSAISDEEFEQLSDAIAKGEDLGDMAPLFEVDEKLDTDLKQWFTPNREKELCNLGINIVEDEIKDKVSHVNVDAERILEQKRQQAINKAAVNKQVEEQLEKEKKQFRSHNVKVRFDDDG